MTDDKFKHFPLPPEGVELMRQYKAVHEAMHADLERLQTELREKAEARHAAGREELREIWVKMAAMAGIDAVTSWDSNDWHVEMRYLESNFAALTFYPQPVNPLAAMFGQQPAEEPEAEVEGAPKGATLN